MDQPNEVDQGTPGTWTWADAWILAATRDDELGATLSELIGTADGINHAIPTNDELASSLGALIGADLVEVSDGRFRTTAAGRAIKKHWSGGLFGWSASLMPHLQRLPRPTVDHPLTRDAVDAACRDYTRRRQRNASSK